MTMGFYGKRMPKYLPIVFVERPTGFRTNSHFAKSKKRIFRNDEERGGAVFGMTVDKKERFLDDEKEIKMTAGCLNGEANWVPARIRKRLRCVWVYSSAVALA